MLAKIKRFLTSALPVARNRTGQCIGCGACCKLPNVCWFLRSRDDGTHYCLIYPIRPPSCRKYPRTKDECLTGGSCGYCFTEEQREGDVPDAAEAGALAVKRRQ